MSLMINNEVVIEQKGEDASKNEHRYMLYHHKAVVESGALEASDTSYWSSYWSYSSPAGSDSSEALLVQLQQNWFWPSQLLALNRVASGNRSAINPHPGCG